MRIKFLILIISIFNIVQLNAQQMDIVWQKCLGTDDADIPGCIAKSDNGILVSQTIGKSADGISNFHGGGDSWVVNIDTTGTIIWEKCFGGSDSDNFMKIIELDNNQYYLIGGTNSNDGDVQSYNHDSYDIWVVKIDSNANIVWENCYGSFNNDQFQDAILTPDGGLIVGAMVSAGNGDISEFFGKRDVWLFRIDSLGNMLWEKSYGNQNMNRINKLIATSYNTYIFIGAFHEPGGMIECFKDESPSDTDVWLVEFDANGELIYQNCYGGSYYEDGNDIIEVDDGFVIFAHTNSDDKDVSGLHGNAGGSVDDFWVFKIDQTGDILWQNCYGGSKTEFAYNIFKTSDNGFMLFGNVWSFDGDVSGNHGTNRPDIWMVKIDQTGNLIWEQCFGSFGLERLPMHGVVQINDYNYILTSETSTLNGDVECLINPYGQYPDDAWVINIKDCSQYQPATPQKPIGKDYLCVNTDSITTYTILLAPGAWYYEWELVPQEAGTLVIDSITAQINWNPTYEGQATIKVRSNNDCGTSTWSDSLIIQTYICLGTEENDANNHFLSIYPNPASSTLTVTYNKPVHKTPTTIEIFDIYGTVVFAQNMQAQKQKIILDISNLTPGLYFVRVIEDDILIGVKKVVVE